MDGAVAAAHGWEGREATCHVFFPSLLINSLCFDVSDDLKHPSTVAARSSPFSELMFVNKVEILIHGSKRSVGKGE